MASLHTTALAMLACALACPSAHADFTISKKATHDVSCISGVCMPTAQNANLNVSELTSMLATGDVALKSGNGDGTAAAIEITNRFTWTGTRRLTLEAKKNVIVRALVTVAGAGALTIDYGEGGAGDLLFSDAGRFRFVDIRSGLVVNGQTYHLVNSIESLGNAVHDDPHGAFALSDTIDAAGQNFGRSPVGTTFKGTFEGLGNSIANLQIKNKTCNRTWIGLFKDSTEGVLRDVRFFNAAISISGVCNYVGILAARGGLITGVYVSGALQVRAQAGCVGEVVGYGKDIRNSTADGSVYVKGRHSNAGGLAGCASSIRSSHSRANVIAEGTKSFAGGLVGGGGSIEQSYATGEVTGQNAGGLAGTSGNVDRSFATGPVAGLNAAGGLLGILPYYATISNSYALGSLSGGVYGGGLFGRDDKSTANIASAYSIGEVGWQTGVTGGFAGYVSSKRVLFGSDYWDVDTSHFDVACGDWGIKCDGVLGLSDVQLKSGLPKGFDPNIWGSDPNINNGYPYLLANPPR